MKLSKRIVFTYINKYLRYTLSNTGNLGQHFYSLTCNGDDYIENIISTRLVERVGNARLLSLKFEFFIGFRIQYINVQPPTVDTDCYN